MSYVKQDCERLEKPCYNESCGCPCVCHTLPSFAAGRAPASRRASWRVPTRTIRGAVALRPLVLNTHVLNGARFGPCARPERILRSVFRSQRSREYGFVSASFQPVPGLGGGRGRQQSKAFMRRDASSVWTFDFCIASDLYIYMFVFFTFSFPYFYMVMAVPLPPIPVTSFHSACGTRPSVMVAARTLFCTALTA
jgi:hypothetical protein